MFWFRRGALEPFATADLAPLFAPECGQLDGTAAHAAERLFIHVAETRGYVALAGETLEALAGSPLGKLDADRLHALNAETMCPEDNPYVSPMRPFWQRYPSLFETYASLRHMIFAAPARRLRSRPR